MIASIQERLFKTPKTSSRGRARLLPRRLNFEGLEHRQLMSVTPAPTIAQGMGDATRMVPAFVGNLDDGHGPVLASSVVAADRLGLASASAPASPAFTAVAVSGTKINLAWSPVSGATGYLVDEWINGAWWQIGNVNSSVTSGTVTGLTPGTTYWFDVGAYNSTGIRWADPRSATTSVTPTVDHPAAATAYRPVSGSLFGANGPSYLDVHQGNLGDCWLLASLAEVAARKPADIRNMFAFAGTAVENGYTVSLYTVRLYNSSGVAKYVTVDTELPSGGTYYDQVNNGPLWVALACG
jgi:hypothetical protein